MGEKDQGRHTSRLPGNQWRLHDSQRSRLRTKRRPLVRHHRMRNMNSQSSCSRSGAISPDITACATSQSHIIHRRKQNKPPTTAHAVDIPACRRMRTQVGRRAVSTVFSCVFLFRFLFLSKPLARSASSLVEPAHWLSAAWILLFPLAGFLLHAGVSGGRHELGACLQIIRPSRHRRKLRTLGTLALVGHSSHSLAHAVISPPTHSRSRCQHPRTIIPLLSRWRTR